MGDFFAPFHLFILLFVFAVFIVPFWQILKKAGFPPPLSLLLWVPLIGLLVLYYVAFSDWKSVENRSNTLP